MKKLLAYCLTATLITALFSACSDSGKIYTEEELQEELQEKIQEELQSKISPYLSEISELQKIVDEYETLQLSQTITITPETAPETDLPIEPFEIPEIEIPDPTLPPEILAGVGKVETERKYLVEKNELPYDLMQIGARYELEQSYFCYSPEMRVRGISGQKNYYSMTIKIPLDDKGLSRQEIEFRITEEEYADLFAKRIDNVIYKTRYQFYQNNYYIAVDVYHEELDGLIVAEVEFKSEDEAAAFKPPSWFREEVTSDKAYKNASLAKNGLPS